MSGLRSFEKLNYSIRPNKNVERKLIVRLLKRIATAGDFKMQDYRYIGLGSVWFVDFSLMHRILGIIDMVSIEREATRQKRLDFNKPFHCIKVIPSEYSEALPDLTWEKRAIVWLDFDDVVKAELFEDLKRTLSQVQSGSVVFVSVNADAWQLDNVVLEERELSPAEALRVVASASDLPVDYESRLARALFPALVGDILGNAFTNTISSSREDLTFVPLLNLTYADNAPFVTYGGIVLNASDLETFRSIDMADLSFLAGPPQFELSIPHLTVKEKLRFDQLLPRIGVPTVEQLGFELRAKEIEAYAKFYLEYPIFAEYWF